MRLMQYRGAWDQVRAYHTDLKVFSIICATGAISILWAIGQSTVRREVERQIDEDGHILVLSMHSYYDKNLPGDGSGMPLCAPAKPDPDVVSFLISLAFFFQGLSFVMEVPMLIGNEALGKYTKFIVRMLGAILVWLVRRFARHNSSPTPTHDPRPRGRLPSIARLPPRLTFGPRRHG